MVETELKVQVPPSSRAAVRRRFATKTARTLNLRARYFDTPDRGLARAELALRLRQEGRQWVQTLKGPGASALHRLEHEVPVDAVGREPTVDIARHAGTPALELIGFAQAGDPERATQADEPAGSLASIVMPRLQHLRRQLKKDAAAFDAMDDARQHRARKRLIAVPVTVRVFDSEAALLAPQPQSKTPPSP